MNLKPLAADQFGYLEQSGIDDLLVATNDTRMLTQLNHEWSNIFQMNDLGKLPYSLGIKFKQSKDFLED